MFKRTTISTGALLALGVISVAPVLAQDAGQRVEITGSAIKRIDAETALPVTIITRQQIDRIGATSTEALLQTISSISSLGGVANATGAGASTSGVSSVSLRGLGDERTLVLVNGRRLSPAAAGGGAAINVNNIPLAAIERVEVLQDGASSIYGSDAVAGVINFILRKDFTGVELATTGSAPTRSGGGRSWQASATAGFGNLDRDRFNLTGSLMIERERALFGRERTFSAKSNVFPYQVGSATGQGAIQGGWNPAGTVNPNASDPWASLKLPGFAGGGLGGSYGTPVAAVGGAGCPSIRMFDAGNVGKINDPRNPRLIVASQAARDIGRYCQFDSGGDVGLIPDREQIGLTLNGAFRVSNSLELFGDALFSKNTVVQQFQPSPVRNSFLQTIPDPWIRLGYAPVLLINPSNPNYAQASAYLTALANSIDPTVPAFAAPKPNQSQAAPGSISRRQEILNLIGQPLAITARVFDFGPRATEDVTEHTRLVLGGRGEIAGQSYEVAGYANTNKLEGRTLTGYFSQTRYANAVSNNNEWNPWSLNQPPGFLAAIAPSNYAGPTLAGETKTNGIDTKLAGDLFKLPAGAVQYAAGIQYRAEKYTLSPSAAYLDGDISGLGGQIVPLSKDRKITSAFGELSVPVVKGLEASLAYRNDRYDDVGNAGTYKVAMRWKPINQLLVRGALGTGFRAPTLEELWYPQTTGTSETFLDPAKPGLAFQSQLTTGGNPLLKPEESRQRSIGLVLEPIAGMSVSLDYWRIKISDIIDEPSTQEVVSGFRRGDPAYAGLVQLDGNGDVTRVQAITANIGTGDVSGIDVGANARFALAGGRMDVGLNGTYMIKYNQTSPSGQLSRKVGTMINPDGSPVLGAEDGGVVLRWKHRLSGTYSTGPWAFTLAHNFYKGYQTSNTQYTDEPHFVPDQSIFDLDIAYTGMRNLRLAVGMKNLLDKNPPIYVPASNQFQSGYDIGQYDPRARLVYVSANYKF